jgi:hypothetical protein
MTVDSVDSIVGSLGTPRLTIGIRLGQRWISASAAHFYSRMEARDGSMGFDFEGTYTNIVDHELIETHSIERQPDGWQAILNNFKRHAESVRG